MRQLKRSQLCSLHYRKRPNHGRFRILKNDSQLYQFNYAIYHRGETDYLIVIVRVGHGCAGMHWYVLVTNQLHQSSRRCGILNLCREVKGGRLLGTALRDRIPASEEMRKRMEKRILVIEDDEAIHDLICMNLEMAGYELRAFMDGREAADELDADHSYDCALVDIMLPGKDGFALLPQLSAYGIPVIFLTAKGDIHSKIKGLTEGAEDYIVKPFEMLELLVRLDKVLKRNQTEEPLICIHGVTIDLKKRKVTKGGEEVYLKPMEFDCLMMFVRNRNKVLTRKQLLGALWGIEFEGETRTVDAHVGRIRKKLDFQDVIKTIPRVGYCLEVEE